MDTFNRDLVELLPRLRRFALSLTRNPDSADDLVQATCVRAIQKQAQFQHGSRLDAWTFTIMRSVFLNQIRAEKKTQGTTQIDADLVGTDEGMRVIEARLALSALDKLILRLNAEQRQALLLVSVEGLSYKEAADVLELPIGTIMSRVSRARIALVRMQEGVAA